MQRVVIARGELKTARDSGSDKKSFKHPANQDPGDKFMRKFSKARNPSSALLSRIRDAKNGNPGRQAGSRSFSSEL